MTEPSITDPTLTAQLAARLHAGQPELLALIERLVLVNSYTRNVAGVNAVGELLADALAGSSLQLTRERPDALGTHLCFSTPAAQRGDAILLIGHHDTVFPPGTFEGFRSADGRAYGPGVLDMKGGLALIVAVLRTLDAADRLASLPLVFVSVSDEEIGSPSSQALLARLAQTARCALVFEAGRQGDRLITARRGSGHARVETLGRAAHAGNALAQGRNAIWTLARFIDAAQCAQFALPGASLNVGLVRGGSARNTVPEQAECEIDLRFSDAEGEAGLRAVLEAARARAELEVPETRCQLHWTTSRKPWARSVASAQLCAEYARHQLAAGLLAGEADVIGGGSDANTVGALGIPTIDGLGPRGSGFHTHAEEIELESLPHKAEALLRFLLAAHKNERT